MTSDENKELHIPIFLTIFVVGCSAIFCFASLRQHPLKFSLTDNICDLRTRDTFLVSIGASLPILVDLVMKTVKKDRVSSSLIFRWMLLIALQIPDIILLSMVDQSVDSDIDTDSLTHANELTKFYVAATVFKLTSSVASVCGIIFSHSNRRTMCSANSVQSGLLLMSSLVYSVLAVVGYGLYSPTSGTHVVAANAAFFIMTFQVLVLFVTCFRSWKLGDTVELETGRSEKNGESIVVLFNMVLLLIRVVSVLLLIVTSGLMEGYSSMTSKSIALDQYFQVAFMVGVLVVPWPLLEDWAFKLMQSAMSEKTAFTRYIAHEVRAPLNVACLSLTFMKAEACVLRSCEDSDQVSSIVEAMSDVDSSCKTAISILNDVLLFDKMKGGKLQLQLKRFFPLDPFTDFHRQFTVVAHHNNIGFVLDCIDEDTGWPSRYSILVDPVRFGQVVRNLLTNAFKFTPRGGRVLIRVSHRKVERNRVASSFSLDGLRRRLSNREMLAVAPEEAERVNDGPGQASLVAVQHPAWLRVEMIDSGAGISKENQKKLFGQYVQFNANSLQKGGGSGLGLWISKGIMTQHGGWLWAESEGEGQGSTFFLEIPLYFASGRAAAAAPPAAAINPSLGKVMPCSIVPQEVQIHHQTLFSSELDLAGLERGETNRQRGSQGQPPPEKVMPDQKINAAAAAGPAATGAGTSEAALTPTPLAPASTGVTICTNVPSNAVDRSAESCRRMVAQSLDDARTGISRRTTTTNTGSSFLPNHIGSSVLAGNTSPIAEEPSAWSSFMGIMDPISPVHAILSDMSPDASDRDSIAIKNSCNPADGNDLEVQGRFGGARERDQPRRGPRSRPKIAFTHPDTCSAESDDVMRSLRVLVVDDSKATRKMMGRALGQRGHKVSFAGDGEEFLELMHGFSGFDVVLMDCYMPRLNGPEAIRCIRGRGYEGFIVGLTGFAETAQLFLASGANHVLPKPFEIESFHAIAREFFIMKKRKEDEFEKKEQEEASSNLGTSTHLQRKARHDIGSLRVLVVDDSKATRKVMGRVLAQEGHTVAFACDGNEFLEVMHGVGETASPLLAPLLAGDFVSFDVVLMDYHMPELEGPEATRRIREEGYTGLIFGLSGDNDHEQVTQFKAHGADEVLPKPFDMERFHATMQRLRQRSTE